MADVVTTSSALAADLVPLLIKEKLLSIAEKQTVFFELGDKENLPEGNGKTIQFTRYERLNLPTATLTEGSPPDAQALTTSVVQAVVDQWGGVVSITDVAQLTVKHPVLRIAQDRLGTQHSELIDREIQKTLMGSSNVSFAGSATSRSGLGAGNFVATDDIRKVVSTLRNNGAPTYEGGMYAGVLDPFVEMDATKDTTFVNAASYSNIRALFVNEIGQWMGVRWKRSNLIPILTAMANGDVTETSPAATGTETGFAAVPRWKATRLDPVTGFETAIRAEVALTAFTAGDTANLTIATAAATGIYNLYVSLSGGAAGTTTFQTSVNHVAGVAETARIFFQSGTPNLATDFVVKATGAIGPPDTSTAGNVHISYVFGREAFGVVDLAGMMTTITPPTPSVFDPLMQLRKVGWKQLFKTVIKNTDFYRRLESLSAFN